MKELRRRILVSAWAAAFAWACGGGDGVTGAKPDDTDDGESDTDTGTEADTETAADPQPLSVDVMSPADGATVVEGGALEFTAQVEGGVPPYSASWSFDGAAPESAALSPGEVAMVVPGEHTAVLAVTDAEEITVTASVAFTVDSLLGGMGIWFGNLHSHSGASDGEGEPSEALAWARDEAGLDFYAMTDHSEMLFGNEWEEIGAAVALFDAPGEFAALRGFEWSHPINGHMCIYETADFNAAYSAFWISFIYEWLDEQGGLAQFNHPGREIGVFNDLALDEPVVDNMFAIETGNKDDGNNDGEFLPYYVQALDNGWRVAPTNNQDNHELAVNSHRTAYVGSELSSAALIEAMIARRLYSTDDPNINIVFRAGAAWMGESVVAPMAGALAFAVKVMDDEPIFGMRVITNAGLEAAAWTPPTAETTSALWTPEVDAASGDWFYLEVVSIDENDGDGPYQIAVTAPIWVE